MQWEGLAVKVYIVHVHLLYGHAIYHINIVYMFTTALIIIFYLNKFILSSPQM